MAKIEKCPHCGSTDGVYSKEVMRYDQYYDYNGEEIGSSEGISWKYRKTTPLYCIDCHKRIGTYEKMFQKKLTIPS